MRGKDDTGGNQEVRSANHASIQGLPLRDYVHRTRSDAANRGPFDTDHTAFCLSLIHAARPPPESPEADKRTDNRRAAI